MTEATLAQLATAAVAIIEATAEPRLGIQALTIGSEDDTDDFDDGLDWDKERVELHRVEREDALRAFEAEMKLKAWPEIWQELIKSDETISDEHVSETEDVLAEQQSMLRIVLLAKDSVDRSLPTLEAVHSERGSRRLVQAITERDRLASRYAVLSNEITSSRSKFYNLEKQIALLRERSRSMIKCLQTAPKENIAVDEGVQKRIRQLDEELEIAKKRREILRNIVQGLIIESKFDWVSDKELLGYMELAGEYITVD